MESPIKLIVGLGNPGPEYEATRHNAGAWFVNEIGQQFRLTLRNEAKLMGACGVLNLEQNECRIFIPSTFMNHSGQALKAICNFYKISPASILVAHDDLDLDPGTIRLKFDGGHGGHNGLRDIIAHLNTKEFHRLRIGIGHPGNRHQVVDFVLNRPNKSDLQRIQQRIEDAIPILPLLLTGQIQKAMQSLHTQD